MNLGKKGNGTIFLSEETRKANLAILGIKNTGKAYTVMPYLIDQDIKDKNMGVTIVVDTPDLAWYLLAMAKINGRKVSLIKPSTDLKILDDLLFSKEWNYENIKNTFDYDKAIKNKEIVIIDMEQERYGERAIRATTMLLLQLQSDMLNQRKGKIGHSVYIDGASDYLPFIKNLLKYGDYYNFNTTLFLKSRAGIEEGAILLDNFVRNYMLLQGINYDDAEYFGRRMVMAATQKESVQCLVNRDYKEFAYEIISPANFRREVGFGTLMELTDDYKKEIKEKAAYWKKRTKVYASDDPHVQLDLEKKKLKLEDEEEETYLGQIEKHVVEEEQKPEEKKDLAIPEEKPVETMPEEPKKEKKKKDKSGKKQEPQMDKFVKVENVETPKKDFGRLDEFVLPEPEETLEFDDDFFVEEPDFSEDFPDEINKEPEQDYQNNVDDDFNQEFNIDLEEDEPQKEEKTFELNDNLVFDIGKGNNKNLPYSKIQNKKIARRLNRFKI